MFGYQNRSMHSDSSDHLPKRYGADSYFLISLDFTSNQNTILSNNSMQTRWWNSSSYLCHYMNRPLIVFASSIESLFRAAFLHDGRGDRSWSHPRVVPPDGRRYREDYLKPQSSFTRIRNWWRYGSRQRDTVIRRCWRCAQSCTRLSFESCTGSVHVANIVNFRTNSHQSPKINDGQDVRLDRVVTSISQVSAPLMNWGAQCVARRYWNRAIKPKSPCASTKKKSLQTVDGDLKPSAIYGLPIAFQSAFFIVKICLVCDRHQWGTLKRIYPFRLNWSVWVVFCGSNFWSCCITACNKALHLLWAQPSNLYSSFR